ncbi:hypothetical protein [Sphingomonas jaspsi]|uniref:hypothetical protein n=1 Tax=Sphingomonas jaspsi TaxID=392409 RepID=UPI0004B2726D|nr:hypothetical protein [Sphingomonas jaspsi]
MTPRRIFLIGIAATLAFSALWHGPLGAGERFAKTVDQRAERTIRYNDVPEINGRPVFSAKMQRAPLTRRVLIEGNPDGFQRAELARILNDIYGILDASWVDPKGGFQPNVFLLPLAVEAQLLGLVSFALGMIIGYLFELRRRANIYKKRI